MGNQALLNRSQVFTEEELSLLDQRRIPSHIALIMDGNRRWAKNQGFPPLVGHWRGAETLSKIVRAASDLGVKTLTVYAFSTENWNRSSLEIKALMRLLKSYLHRKRRSMLEDGVRLTAIGDLSRLSPDLREVLEESIEATASGDVIELSLAVSYGGRDEIRRAIGSIVEDYSNGQLLKSDLSEELISEYLDTAGKTDPELIIRSGGENRLSNFLLWQMAYSEMVITKVLWPDFSARDLLEAVSEYQRRELRRGL